MCACARVCVCARWKVFGCMRVCACVCVCVCCTYAHTHKHTHSIISRVHLLSHKNKNNVCSTHHTEKHNPTCIHIAYILYIYKPRRGFARIKRKKEERKKDKDLSPAQSRKGTYYSSKRDPLGQQERPTRAVKETCRQHKAGKGFASITAYLSTRAPPPRYRHAIRPLCRSFDPPGTRPLDSLLFGLPGHLHEILLVWCGTH